MSSLRHQKTTLVAGGAGFIGSHLCRALLEKGHRVFCLDNLSTGSEANLRSLERESHFHFLKHDICSPLPASLKVNQIYNLACPASPTHYQSNPIHTTITNVVGTKNLLDLAESCAAKLVQASTSEVYGDPEQHPQQEEYWGHVNPIGPRACYDEGKRCAETLCFDYRRQKRVDVRVLRIFNTYGPRMRPDDGRIVSNFIVQAISRKPITIYGSGNQTRSFCYIDDMIRGLRAMMESATSPTIPVNLGNPEEHSVQYVAELIGRLTDVPVRLAYEPLPADDPKRRKPDIALAERMLGWRPKVKLAKGLPPTIDWFVRCLKRDLPPLELTRDINASV